MLNGFVSLGGISLADSMDKQSYCEALQHESHQSVLQTCIITHANWQSTRGQRRWVRIMNECQVMECEYFTDCIGYHVYEYVVKWPRPSQKANKMFLSICYVEWCFYINEFLLTFSK